MEIEAIKIGFLLPAYGGTGGSNSVVYDAVEFRRFGIETKIFAPDYVFASLSKAYGAMPDFEAIFQFYDSMLDSQLYTMLVCCSHLVATIWSSVSTIAKFVGSKDKKLYYFVQDYEPLFYEPGSNEEKMARETYDYEQFKLYAKSDRIINLVFENHGRHVFKVLPSIRNDIFYPNFGLNRKVLNVGVMLRPSTPYRNSVGTLSVLSEAQKANNFQVQTFGCSTEQADELCVGLGVKATNHGLLTPPQVGEFFRTCDAFIDLSFHQGFGRLGLEAAACGCACIMPEISGLHEILRADIDCYYRNANDHEGAVEAVLSLVTNQRLLREMRISGAVSAGRISSHAAALSSLEVLLSSATSNEY